MNKLKDKKVIAIIVVLVILFVSSIIIYGKNSDKIFSDKYMKNIFVKENEYIGDNTKETLTQSDSKEVLVNTESEDLNSLKIVVEIKGEVLNPDVYELDEGSIVKDLIDMAGGLTENGDTSNINRAKKLQNHELVVVLNKNDENNISVSNDNNIHSDGVININSADINELKKITGIGDVKAQSIIDYREKNGGFKSIDEIKNVDGIGEKTFEKIKEEITS